MLRQLKKRFFLNDLSNVKSPFFALDHRKYIQYQHFKMYFDVKWWIASEWFLPSCGVSKVGSATNGATNNPYNKKVFAEQRARRNSLFLNPFEFLPQVSSCVINLGRHHITGAVNFLTKQAVQMSPASVFFKVCHISVALFRHTLSPVQFKPEKLNTSAIKIIISLLKQIRRLYPTCSI